MTTPTIDQLIARVRTSTLAPTIGSGPGLVLRDTQRMIRGLRLSATEEMRSNGMENLPNPVDYLTGAPRPPEIFNKITRAIELASAGSAFTTPPTTGRPIPIWETGARVYLAREYTEDETGITPGRIAIGEVGEITGQEDDGWLVRFPDMGEEYWLPQHILELVR